MPPYSASEVASPYNVSKICHPRSRIWRPYLILVRSRQITFCVINRIMDNLEHFFTFENVSCIFNLFNICHICLKFGKIQDIFSQIRGKYDVEIGIWLANKGLVIEDHRVCTLWLWQVFRTQPSRIGWKWTSALLTHIWQGTIDNWATWCPKVWQLVEG